MRSHLPDVETGGTTVHAQALRHAARLGAKPALIDGATGRTVSYADLAAGVGRVAGALQARGFARGDVVAFLSPNTPEYAVAAYGVMAAGGVVTGANPLLTVEELAAQLADSGARMLITLPPFREAATTAAAKAGVEEVVFFGDLIDHELSPAYAETGPNDLAALPFSSGTTGLSKGVELTHASLVTNARQSEAVLGLNDDDVVLAAAPFFHVLGFTILLLGSLSVGATVVTQARFDLEDFLRAIQQYRVTLTIVVPPVALGLAHHPAVDAFDLSSLRGLGVGAAPLGAAIEQRCAERLGCQVSQGLGMTEAAALISAGPLDDPRRGSCGRLVPNTEARIVDPESQAELPPGRTGELWVRGPQLMRGYRDHPAETARTIDADGWLHTGDLCYFDADGYLYVVDRLKELIKYKGYQVAPAELEALLLSHPAVADAAVVRRPDPEAGEVPVAHVVLRAEAQPQDLIEYVAERVAPYKRLRAVHVTDSVPRSPAGKLLRRLL